MDELLTWLRAQLDEDERVAREVQDHVYRAHIARWDPARVLAEIDAKRRMLHLHDPYPHQGGWPITEYLVCSHCAALCHSRSGLACDDPVDALYPCETVRLLALPYADAPGYREEWRPVS